MAKGASASGARPFFLVWIELKSAFLDAEGLVTAAALLADDGQRRLQRIEIRDLALSVRYGLAEACDVLAETSLGFPELPIGAVIALPLGPLEAVGKQRRKILGSILELGERGINRGLVIWLFALDYRSQRAGVLSVALHVSLRMLERILLRYHRADTEQQLSNNHDSSHHQFDPSGFSKRTVNSLPRSQNRCSHPSNTTSGISFPQHLHITDYAGADARESRSRPARRSQACRYDRSRSEE